MPFKKYYCCISKYEYRSCLYQGDHCHLGLSTWSQYMESCSLHSTLRAKVQPRRQRSSHSTAIAEMEPRPICLSAIGRLHKQHWTRRLSNLSSVLVRPFALWRILPSLTWSRVAIEEGKAWAAGSSTLGWRTWTKPCGTRYVRKCCQSHGSASLQTFGLRPESHSWGLPTTSSLWKRSRGGATSLLANAWRAHTIARE